MQYKGLCYTSIQQIFFLQSRWSFNITWDYYNTYSSLRYNEFCISVRQIFVQFSDCSCITRNVAIVYSRLCWMTRLRQEGLCNSVQHIFVCCSDSSSNTMYFAIVNGNFFFYCFSFLMKLCISVQQIFVLFRLQL